MTAPPGPHQPIRALGGPKAVGVALGISPQRVAMWSRRNRIPLWFQQRVSALASHAKRRAA